MEKEAPLLKQSMYHTAGSGLILSSFEKKSYKSTTIYRIL